MAKDSPIEHGAAVDLLDEAGKCGGVAFDHLASGNGLVEKLARFRAEGFELGEGDGAELRIGEVVLEVSQTVGHGFGSGGETATFDIELNERLQRRHVFCTGRGELLRHPSGGGFHGGKKEFALGAETLDERGGNDAGFLGDVGKS